MGDSLFYLAKLTAFLAVPALIGYFAPRRWRVPAVIAWLLLPVLIALGLVLREILLERSGGYEAAVYAEAFGFFAAFVLAPWLFFSGIGFALGFALRRRRRAPSTPVGPSKVSEEAVAPPIAPRASQGPWIARHVGFERDGVVLDGINVWAATWGAAVGPSVRLPHPSYPDQLHDFRQYDLAQGPRAIRIAVTELSAGVYGFYTWRADDVVSSGLSADGSLRYENRVPDTGMWRIAHPPAVASVRNAATGAVIADGSGWALSHVTSEADGTLLLSLRQFNTDALFRIDPVRRQFRKVGTSEAPEKLDGLAEAMRKAHAAISERRQYPTGLRVAPDGSIRVELVSTEWSNTHWVDAPRVVAIASGRTLLNLWNSDWDADVSFPRRQVVVLRLRRYRTTGNYYLEIDLAADRFTLFDKGDHAYARGAIPDIPRALENASRGAEPRFKRVPVKAPRAGPPQWLVAFLILAGALIAIAILSFAVQYMRPAPTANLTSLPKMPSLPALQRAP